jgi:nucleoside-diphosphate-sugar epimerase
VIEGRRVLVSGASGFIGRWSVPPLLRMGFEVHAVLSPKAIGSLPAELVGAVTHVADLLNEAQAADLMLRVRPSHLLHFAWVATPGVYWQSEENFRWLAASDYLLGRFLDHGGVRAVLAGSCAEYDWSNAGVCDERSSPLADAGRRQPSPYAASKLAMQRKLALFAAEHHVSAAWGRIFFQFGPHEHADRLVPSVIRNLLMGQAALCSHGKQVRGFLHVADVGSAFASLLDSPVEGPVNVGSDEGIAVAELIDRIARQIGRPELVRLGARTAPPDEPMLLLPDLRRLRGEVHWRPHFTLEQGIKDTIDWWGEHPR